MGDNKINILAASGAGGGVAVDDLGGDGMQYCSEHPYRGASPGGICALCLQEKLGKLVSSSKLSTPFFPPQINSSSSSSPSFRSSSSSISNAAAPPPPPPITTYSNGSRSGRSHNRISSYFISPSAHRKKRFSGARKLEKDHTSAATSVSNTTATVAATLKRSKSVAPRPAAGETLVMDSPRKKSFWSFLSLTSASSSSSSSNNKPRSSSSSAVETNNSFARSHDAMAETPRRDPAIVVVIEDEDSQLSTSSSFGRKVGRSRSVGCGSRSFSGDFLERLSTGFGDCTLRRVESQRESNNKSSSASSRIHHHHQQGGTMKERVKCGGIFGGFGMIYSTSSSYWLSAAAAGDEDDNDAASSGGPSASTPHARSRSWAWAFASAMRAFTRPSPKPTTSTIVAGCHKTPTGRVIAATSTGGDAAARTENRNGGRIDGVPSLLAVGG